VFAKVCDSHPPTVDRRHPLWGATHFAFEQL
jgi:hypothetical protein